MLLVTHPQSDGHKPLSFYLTMEEHLAQSEEKAGMVMVWSVNPTVIIGRNQHAQDEVRLDACRENGVEVYRRRSGGGAVYADTNNVMISFIVDIDKDVDTTFRRCARTLADALRRLGIPAETTGRNDIEVEGRKVSGGAFHNLHRRGIAHFTMLFDADTAMMERLLTPDKEKLSRHGVASVKARVGALSQHLGQMSLADFTSRLTRLLADDERMLSPDEEQTIALTAEQDYPNLADTYVAK